MKKLFIIVALAFASCRVRFEYEILTVEKVGYDFYVVYTINDQKREALLDEESLDRLLEVAQ